MKITSLLSSLLLTFAMALPTQASIMQLGNVSLVDDHYLLQTDAGGDREELIATDTEIEEFLSLETGVLDSLANTSADEKATEGSAISNSFFLNANESILFDWLWQTDEDSATDPEFNDFAFVSITFAGETELIFLADIFSLTGIENSFSWTADEAGLATLGIGVLDVGDDMFNSTLTVSNLRPHAVPEPTALALFAISLLGFGGFMRRRKS